MSPKFGTSGLRGLVTELTDELIADYTRAFVSACNVGEKIYVGHDLRPSSPAMAALIAQEIRACGKDSVDCGPLATPALAMAAANAGAIMVTGSHIPADRNGLKFYTRTGEITKVDETAISGARGQEPQTGQGADIRDTGASARFVARYVDAFGADALTGRKIGVYSHSAVGRDSLMACLRQLGADIVELARSDVFIPVDTEAVDPETRGMLAAWISEHGLDAIASTDGDSDRPMLTDEHGLVIPGDILGQITAQVLGADAVVTPISSNTGVLQKGFANVVQTRIGSPYVIAGMEDLGGRVVGYEANGGTLLGFEAETPNGTLEPLATRDSFLPIVATLVAAKGLPLSQRIAQEPARYTAANRLQGIEPAVSGMFLAGLSGEARTAFLAFTGATDIHEDVTDGLRLTLSDGCIVHLRPSGNAPEFRLYCEADSALRAEELLERGLETLAKTMDQLSR